MAVGPVWERKFLGYCFWAARRGEVRRAVAGEALARLRERIRRLTRTQGRSLEQIAKDLQGYVPGWNGTSGWRRRPRLCATWTSGCVTGCAPCG
jgi:RNA-directed DNA polymerase